MASRKLSSDRVKALEKILGVKLPKRGFALEIKPIEAGADEAASVRGGGTLAATSPVAKKLAPRQWLAKI
jgi:hypothetical protein